MSLLHEEASPKLLRAVTIWVFGFWCLQLAFSPVDSLAALPMVLYGPVGFLRGVPDSVVAWLLSSPVIYYFKAVILLSCAAVIFIIRPRVFAILACASLTVYLGLLRGFGGHVSHSDLVMLYAAYFLALFTLANARLSAQERSRVNLSGVPVVAVLAALFFTYSLTGLFRLMHGAIETFTSGSLTFWAMRNSYQYVDPLWGWGRQLLNQPVWAAALNAGFPFVTLFEVLAPLCFVSSRFRWVFIVVMLPFHLLAWIVMEIFFWEPLLLYGLFFERSGRQQGGARS